MTAADDGSHPTRSHPSQFGSVYMQLFSIAKYMHCIRMHVEVVENIAVPQTIALEPPFTLKWGSRAPASDHWGKSNPSSYPWGCLLGLRFSDFIFLASAYEGGWRYLSLAVSSSQRWCMLIVLITAELAWGTVAAEIWKEIYGLNLRTLHWQSSILLSSTAL